MWLLLMLAITVHAQQGVSLYIDPQNRNADTLDFGYVLAGDTVARSLFIENSTDEEIVIPQGTRPYLWIEATPPFRDNDPEEFPLEALFPFRVSAGQTRTYPLRYAATLFAQLHPEGKHQVALNVSVRQSLDTAVIGATRRFILRVTKSFRPLWSDATVLDFDSVYVDSPLDRVRTLQVRNVYQKGVPVQILQQGDAASLQAFTLDVDASDFFAGQQLKEYAVHFRPVTPALAVLDVLLIHPSPLRNGAPDTTALQLRGVGVTQRLVVRQVLAPNTSIVGDTIIARNRKVGVADTIAIVVENAGNIALGAVETRLAGDVRQVTLLKGLRGESRLAPLRFDTIVVVVRPAQAGTLQAQIDVLTDLLQRGIWGVPPEAVTIHFTLLVESQPPRLVALTTEQGIDAGTVLALGPCTDRYMDTLELRNQSLEPVTVTAIVAPPPFRVTLTTPLVVAPGQTLPVPIEVEPTQPGTTASILRIESSDTAYSPLEVPVRVRVIAPPEPTIRIPSVEYIPGQIVAIPLLADTALQHYSAMSLLLAFDPTMVQLTGLQLAGTAAQGATAQLQSLGQGQYRLQIATAARFVRGDTIAVLLGQTYLGELPSSHLRLEQVKVGSTQCPDAIPGSGIGGELSVVPFCGMQYKFPIALPLLTIVSADAVVSARVLVLECWSRGSGRAQAVLYSADGRAVAEWALDLQVGLQRYILPLAVPEGIYALRVRTQQQTTNEAQRVLLVR